MATSQQQRRALMTAIPATMAFGVGGAARAEADGEPLHVVVPYTTGGLGDTIARLVMGRVASRLNRPLVVLSKPGANSMLGSDFVAKSKPDGNTLLVVIAAHAINPSLHRTMPFDPLRDLTGVTLIGSIPMLLVSSAKLPPRTIEEFVAYCKGQQGGLFFASTGVGSAAHLSGLLLARSVGMDLTHVPYSGSAVALPDLFSGQVAMMFDTFQTMMPHVKAGRLHALAVSSAERWPGASDVPTISETVARGFVAGSWIGLIAPSGTPKEALSKLSSEAAEVIQSSEVHDKLIDYGIRPVGSSAEQFDTFIRDEARKWGDLIRALKISVD